jgi:hypothetical protein
MVDPRLLEPTPKELARAASPATLWAMTACCVAGVVLGGVMGWTWGGSDFADPGTTFRNGVPLEGGALLALYSALAVGGISALLIAPIALGLWRDWRATRVRRILIAAGAAGIVGAGLIGAIGFDPDRAVVVERYGYRLGEPPAARFGELLDWLGALSSLSWAFVALGVAVGALLAVEIWLVRARGPQIVEQWRRALGSPGGAAPGVAPWSDDRTTPHPSGPAADTAGPSHSEVR